MILFLSALALLLSPSAGSSGDGYSEELILSRLPNSHLAAHFSFKATRSRALDEAHHDLFPAKLAQLFTSYGLDELRLSLSQGHWRSESFGLPPQPAAPTGALLHAIFHNESGINERWAGLVEALSGSFCASLSGIATGNTGIPDKGFAPLGLVPDSFAASKARLALSSQENLCTENLSPWKKLLPCKDVGLSSLLIHNRVLHSHFTSMSLLVRRVEPSGLWEASLKLSVVFDAPVQDRYLDWSLRSIFHTNLPGLCPLSSTSALRVRLNYAPNTKLNVPDTFIRKESVGGQEFLHVDLDSLFANETSKEAKAGANLACKTVERAEFGRVAPPYLRLHSFLGGSGEQDGRLISRMTNRAMEPIKALFSQLVPWYTRPFLHTLIWSCAPLDRRSGVKRTKPLFTLYKPGEDRKRPHLFQLGLRLPPLSVCQVELEVERQLLRWTEYPPDAHRGFSLPPASLHFLPPSMENLSLPVEPGTWLELWGEAVLVSLPTPDFSMPYNVICLVCTVVALAFGPVHNLTTKSLILLSEDELKRKAPLFKLKAAIARALHRLHLCPQSWRQTYLQDPGKEVSAEEKEEEKENEEKEEAEESDSSQAKDDSTDFRDQDDED